MQIVCWLEHFQCIINSNNIQLRDELRAKLLPNSHIDEPSVALCAAAVAVVAVVAAAAAFVVDVDVGVAMTFRCFLLVLFHLRFKDLFLMRKKHILFALDHHLECHVHRV